MDFFTTVGFVSSAITIAEKGTLLKSITSKISHYLKNGNYVVLVFGSGGTGKTTLSGILTGHDITDFNYQESSNVEKVNLEGDIWGYFLVAPGQDRRVERYWPELFRKLGAGKVAGVINVVSYGYHSADIGEISYKESIYYSTKRDKQFLKDYLNTKRKHEIELLNKISEQIKNAPNKFWMITLVNKQDLWWKERKVVKNYYTNGVYNQIINQIIKSKGSSNFIHEYISASITHSNFRIGKDFQKEIAAGYDEPIRLNNFNNFVKLLNKLLHNDSD